MALSRCTKSALRIKSLFIERTFSCLPSCSKGVQQVRTVFYGTEANNISNSFSCVYRNSSVSPFCLVSSIRKFASLPSHNIIKLPSLSPTMETGNVASWAKNEGDKVEEGDLLAEIETDKATMPLETSQSGFLAKILLPAGTSGIPVGSQLCIIVESAGDVAAFKDFKATEAPPAKAAEAAAPAAPAPAAPAAAAPAPAATPAPAPPAAQPRPAAAARAPAPGGRVISSPLARALAKQQGIDLATLAGLGTGPQGRIRAADLALAKSGAVAGGAAGAGAGAPFIDLDLSNLRAVNAQRMTESKQVVPHYYLTVEITIDEVLRLREQMNKKLAGAADSGKGAPPPRKLSVNDFVIKAVTVACERVPECNSSWQNTFIRQYTSIDVNVALSTPDGLIAPIVFAAETKGLLDINEDVMQLSAKAKEKKLQPHEIEGGTFTVNNLGMFGVTNFCAVINPPQACVLSVGGTQTRLVLDSKAEGGARPSSVMAVTLCCDHRVVDGAVGARWLAEFRQALEQPITMLL